MSSPAPTSPVAKIRVSSPEPPSMSSAAMPPVMQSSPSPPRMESTPPEPTRISPPPKPSMTTRLEASQSVKVVPERSMDWALSSPSRVRVSLEPLDAP